MNLITINLGSDTMIPNIDKTTKEEDMAAEKELTKFLDTYLYDRLKSKCKKIKRITDKTQQIQGIDVMIEYENNHPVIIDEKAQLHYIDVCRKTFAFEIDFIGRDDNLHLGWLYNDDLKTNTYMLIWPEKTSYHEMIQLTDSSKQLSKIKEILRNIKCDDFESADCYLIKRNNIKSYLASNGWDEERILNKAKELRDSKKYGRTQLTETKPFYFYFSNPSDYREAPINIIIKRYMLRKLAHRAYRVTKNRLQFIL